MLHFRADFYYMNADMWYKNLDKLIEYVNARQDKYHVYYSTPSCYLFAVHNVNQTYSTKSDDFFPYGTDPHSYDTGFFTSRPALKYYERVGNNYLQVCKHLGVLSRLSSSYDEKISYLRDAMGVLQHHDAITGTHR